MKILVIGANAAGAKAAAKAKRLNPAADVTVVDRGEFISYGACGIPYYVGDTVKDVAELMSTPVGVVRDAAFFAKVKGVTVVTGTEAVELDRAARKVTLLERKTGAIHALHYDRLVLATGSHPASPVHYNMQCPSIVTVKSIEDAERLKERAVPGTAVCVVGGGLIGLETAEALQALGLKVTVLEMREHILPGVLDPEMAHLVEKEMRANGVEIVTSCRVIGFDGTSHVEQVITDRGEYPAELVVCAPGVRPNVILAEQAGLALGTTGAIAVDERMRTSDPHIFACGDCCETTHLLTGRKVYLPMGSTANKQGRVAGINAAGGDVKFAGVLGTAIIRVFGCNAGKTGLTETEARSNGYDVETVLAPAHDRAHFMPSSRPIAVKLVADRATGRILGVQAAGPGAVDKRIDAAAAALTFGATAEQLSQLDLAYAPPFSTAMDSLIVAADVMKNKLAGEAKGIGAVEVRRKLEDGDDFVLLDVRSPAEHGETRIAGAKLVPLGALREKLDALPRDKEIITFCKISLRGYEAQKILQAAGFSDVKFMDGGLMTWPYELEQGDGEVKSA